MKTLYLFLFSLCINLSLVAQSNLYLHFDGVDDYAGLENGVALLDGTDQITMAGWFYTDALSYGQGMMGIREGGDGDQMYLIQLSNGYLECRIVINGALFEVAAPNGTINAGVWQHVAWVYDGSTVELFIDGISKGSSSASGVFHGTTKPFSIGKLISGAGNFSFKGKIDEISLWNIALTQGQIQTSMTAEFLGTESGLVAYYKFDQGTPGDDNTFITHLTSETGEDEAAVLYNFALTGTTSNFDGVLDPDFQSINFPTIPNKLILDAPFNLEAFTSSGLDVVYTVESGPATVSGSLVTLDGVQGEVVIKASQPGNGTYNPATDVFSTFNVLDPSLVLADIELLNPTDLGDVPVPILGPIHIAAKTSIAYTDIFSVDDFLISINNQPVSLTNHQNGRFTGWYTPTAYGNQNVEITATNNYGYSNIENSTINIVNTAQNEFVAAATDIWLNGDIYSEEVEITLPSYMGAYDNILGSLIIECPPGGCDPWDRVSSVQLQSHDGKWHEIIRYITPYGVACNHEIDLTDFMSMLQGTVKFRFNLGTQGNGFLYSLNLDYTAGSPNYNYSTVQDLWNNTYQFGDYANLQPCEGIAIDYTENIEAARIKLVSTGHGWGDLNTGNAAEFHRDLHNIWVDGVSTFSQDNWLGCNPNPDGCQPQNGTWYHNRAGWCPGAIAPWFDFDLSSVNTNETMDLNYIFDEDYVDLCHPNHPNCVTGVTCSDCNAGFNPHLIVACHLVSYGDNPITPNMITISTNDFENPGNSNDFNFTVFPNPNKGKFVLDTYNMGEDTITIFDINGKLVAQFVYNNFQENHLIDISYITAGVYFVKVSNIKGSATKKFIKI